MKKEKQKKPYMNPMKRVFICVVVGIVSVLAIISSIVYYRKQIVESSDLINDFKKESYEKHYAMITSDSQLSFWKNVYARAKESAKRQGAYLELLGTNLDVEYSQVDLMKIAIQS